MKNILKLFTRWSREQSSEDIAEFADWFFGFRFGLPGFDPEQGQVQEQIARLALPFYSARTNVDGRPSLLAVLGAVSEAERFFVDPEVVMRKAVGWRRLKKIAGPTLGGTGVADLGAAFELAEREFKEHLASLERAAMESGLYT